jgi:hypothetical protein
MSSSSSARIAASITFSLLMCQKEKREHVLNLLTEGIINADGTPGPNFAKAHQFQMVSAPNGGKFFSSADMANKGSTRLCHRPM